MTATCDMSERVAQKANTPRVSGPRRVLTSPTCKEVEMATDRVCAIDGCCKPVVARGWCAAHYRRWQIHRDPLGFTPRKLGEIQTWVADVAVLFSGEDCLIWPFSRTEKGYATWTVDGRPQNASRVICRMVHGEPPSHSHVAAHNCFSGHLGCVNPQHLRWATASENEQDKVLSGTSNRGSRHGLSKLKDEDVRAIRALAGIMTQAEIAEKFGVSKWAVGDIIRRKRWAWLA